MIKNARAKDLIREHAELRKQAFAAVQPSLGRTFIEAEGALLGCKTAAEQATFNPTLFRHFVEP